MELQDLINLAVLLFGGIGGWLFRTLWNAQERMRTDFSEMEKNLPKIYVLKDDFAVHAQRIETTLQRIEDKLDLKMDKA